VSLEEVTIWIFRLLFLLGLFSRLENLICKALQLVTVTGLVLSLGVENADPVQETFKLSWSGQVLLVMTHSLYVSYGVVRLTVLVITLQGARLIRMTQLLVLLLLSGVEGRLLGQGILVGDGQYLLRHPKILHGELADKR
jgi:hypothetical protein